MDQVHFNSVTRTAAFHVNDGRGMQQQKNMGHVQVNYTAMAPSPPHRRPSQSKPPGDPYHHRIGFSELVRSILPGQDFSATSKPRRSPETPIVNSIDNTAASLIPELDKTLNALEAEKQLTRRLLAEKAALETDNQKLIKANSSLAKENTAFKKQLQLESEEDLIKQLRELHNAIQCWCQKFFETTATCRSTAELPRLPFAYD